MTWLIYIPLVVALIVIAAVLVGKALRDARETGSLPGCFGSNPSYQERAENDCFHCVFQHICLPEATSEGHEDETPTHD